MIYFDNAATSFPKPPQVARAVAKAVESFGNPARGSHPFSLAAMRAIERARSRAATLFHCGDPGRIAFTKNVTEALNLAVNSLDGHIVTTEAEHNSILRPVYRRGNFSLVPVDECGRYDLADIASHCRADTEAIVVAHASNLTGMIAPVAELGSLCREKGIFLIVDAAQSAGLLDIDMEAQGIDALCFTGHKALYGLQGTGGISLGPRFTPRPLLVGGSGSHTFSTEQPQTLPELLEAGTPNSHGIASLSAGLAFVLERGPAALWKAADALAMRFLAGIRGISGLRLYGDYATPRRMPIVALNLGNRDSSEVAAFLADGYGIAVRAGAHCAPLLHKRFGTEKQGAVRFSFSHFNTPDEIDIAVSALMDAAENFSGAAGWARNA